MEKFMLKAHELQAQGLTQKQIAAQLGKTDRTIRTWLKQMPRERKRPVRKSKLDEYKPFVEAIVRENPGVNGARVYDKLVKKGFAGKSSIVREFITKIRREESQKAVIRFETEPGHQAQVDWIEFGCQHVNGGVQKLYAFVMVMGYSRMPYVRFATRMDSATLLHCHIVNAGEKFPKFAGLKFPLLGKKYINRSRRLRPSCGPSFCRNPPAGLLCGSGAEACPDLQLQPPHRCS